MDWIHALEVIGLIGGIATVLAMFLGPMLWLGAKIDGISQDLNSKIDDIKKENKDFHGRLCTLEERYLQIITDKNK